MSSILKVDTINEVTSANGVTVDGLSIKDSKLVTANSVVTTNITDANVTTAKITDANVTTAKIADVNVTEGKIADNAITLAKMASGTDGNIISYDASGNPVAIATGNDGQVLTSTGAGSQPAFETLPVGGITGADSWRLTSSFSGSAATIQSNLERVDTDGYGTIGSAMTVSSGIFTFPTTGIWLIEATFFTRCNGANRAHAGGMSTTTNNSSYSDAAGNYSSMFNSGNDTYSNSKCSFIFDVTSTSTHKVIFYVSTDNSSSVTAGDTNSSLTAFTFIRLGDT
jgi:hypothetical protein